MDVVTEGVTARVGGDDPVLVRVGGGKGDDERSFFGECNPGQEGPRNRDGGEAAPGDPPLDGGFQPILVGRGGGGFDGKECLKQALRQGCGERQSVSKDRKVSVI